MEVCARKIENVSLQDRFRRRGQFRDLGLGEHVNPVTVSSNIGALPGARDVICSKFGHVRNHRRSLCYRFTERSTRHATTL